MLYTFHLNEHLLNALNNQEAEYLVVGGLAVQHYCPERIEVGDLDILINPTLENAKRVIDALINVTAKGIIEYDPNKMDYRKLITPTFQIPLKMTLNADILTPGKHFDFNLAFLNSLKGQINEIQVRIMSCCDLIRHKDTDREKDQDDVKLLRLKCTDCD